MRRHATTLTAAAMTLASLTSAAAQNADTVAEDIPVDNGRLDFELGAEVVSAYLWRGYVYEDSGLIVQPYADIGVSLVDGAAAGPSIDLHFGTWNSFHSEHTDATDDSGVSTWYEGDFYAGATLGWDWMELDLSYWIYAYPSSDFNSVQELIVTSTLFMPEAVGAWIGDLSLELGIETDNSNVADDEAVYLGLEFGPSFDLFDGDATLSVPVTLGFSVHGFYLDENGDDDTFGFGSVGAMLEVPLGEGDYGAWTVWGSVSYAFLGNALEQAHPEGDDNEIVGVIGMSVSY